MNFPDLDAEFDAATVDVEAVTPLAAMWAEAEEKAALISEFPPSSAAVGRIALDTLPESEHDEAWDEFFYVYAQARAAGAETRERWESERQPRAELNAKLAALREYRRYGDPTPDGLLDDIARLADVLHGGGRGD